MWSGIYGDLGFRTSVKELEFIVVAQDLGFKGHESLLSLTLNPYLIISIRT